MRGHIAQTVTSLLTASETDSASHIAPTQYVMHPVLAKAWQHCVPNTTGNIAPSKITAFNTVIAHHSQPSSTAKSVRLVYF
jgi:hypothetical protein